MSTASATEGELIAGKYRVTRKLDSGGMADVFLARAEGAAGFARTVVIKRLAPSLAGDPELVTMFLDEARIAARLHHSNIAQVFDFGTDASGYYLAMEFLAGRDALDLVRAAHPGYLPLSAAVAIATGAAAGLHHAHEQRDDAGRSLGIVHRDVTASNLFVTVDGAVKVIDFGIAHAADRLTRTRTGMVKGTTAYLSPEQAAGRALDRRSDLFQLGVVLYELVTGVRPFDQRGDSELAIADKIAAGVYTPAATRRPECPADLDALIARLLAVDPARRLPTGEAVIVELDALVRRHGWSTAPHELARVVRELFPANPGGDTPDTLVDRGGVDTAAGTGEDDRAAILAGLEAPVRGTAPAVADPAPPTVRGRTPVMAPPIADAKASLAPAIADAMTRPAPPAFPLATRGIPTLDGPAPAPVAMRPRLGVPGRAPAPAAGSWRSRAVAAVSLVAGGALVVIAIVVLARQHGPATGAVTDARIAKAEVGLELDAAAEIDAAPSEVDGCIDNANRMIRSIRTLLEANTKIRAIREAWSLAKSYIGEGVGFMHDICPGTSLDPRRDGVDAALDELEAQIANREAAIQLEFGYIDDAGIAVYKDSHGDWLTKDEVDAR